jgi:hypothetical protein
VSVVVSFASVLSFICQFQHILPLRAHTFPDVMADGLNKGFSCTLLLQTKRTAAHHVSRRDTG